MFESHSGQPKTNKKPAIYGAAGVALAGIIGTTAFYLGTSKNDPSAPANQKQAVQTANANPAEVDLKIKGNKSSRIFHLQGCPNYNDIAERNIVWFKTAEEAKTKGFRMAKNC